MKTKNFYKLLIVLVLPLINLSQNNINISNGNVFDGEPYLAINPVNKNNMVIAWMGYVFGNGSGLTIKVKRSTDRGMTWSAPINLLHMKSTYKSADVSMAYDASGILHLTYIDYRESPDSGGVWYTRSTNNGASFITPVKVIDAYADGSKRPLDRPWLAADASGNNLVVTTKPAPWITAPNRAYFINSTNGGVSWQPWRYIDTTNFLIGPAIAAPMAFPAINSNSVFIIYPSYVSSQNIFPQFLLARSNSWGNTFTYKSILAANTSAAQNDSAKSAYQIYTNPINANHLAVLMNAGVGSNDLDVYFTESLNSGNTWSSPLKLNDDALGNGKMQDLVWGAFNETGGFAAVWRDRRNSAGPGYARATEIFGTYRAASSSSFIPNFKISDTIVAYNNVLSQNGNDFLSMKLISDTLCTTWGTTRDGSLDIWFSKLKAGGIPNSLKLITSESTQLMIYPNPGKDIFKIKSLNNDLIEEIEIYSIENKLIRKYKPHSLDQQIDLTGEANGIYLVRAKFKNNVASVKLIKE